MVGRGEAVGAGKGGTATSLTVCSDMFPTITIFSAWIESNQSSGEPDSTM